ncbi:MAG: GNAT family N-acetyltransferase [Aeromicrobium sp.]
MSDEITVTQNLGENRYEVHSSGTLAGFAEYQLPDEEHVDFTHTTVDDDFSGEGLAERLVAEAIADVQQRGKRVVPHCSYVAKWLTEHPEHDDIVDWP